MADIKLRNARIVLADREISGAVHVVDGVIEDVTDAPVKAGEDLDGDWLIPGLVELHTDHLEGHYMPRPRVRWNPLAAVQAHDAQIASSGITTVFDALRVGMDEDSNMGNDDIDALADAIDDGMKRGRFRADHFIHARCEVCAEDVMDGFRRLQDHPRLRLTSLMDHTPGQRQFTSMDAFRAYYQGKTGMSDEAFGKFVAMRQARAGVHSDKHRALISAICRDRGITLASHDDARADHVDEAVEHGVALAEFPTTMEAAEASHKAGLKVLMGAPNVVRGGSHSGNVSARDLAETGLLDVLSSDYLPFSLLQAAFLLAETPAIPMADAIAMVSRKPAEAAGLDDRGAIEPGKRADLVRVHVEGGIPIVRAVWRQGHRVV